ncbi:hypothetical protein [Flavobacterium sp.]
MEKKEEQFINFKNISIPEFNEVFSYFVEKEFNIAQAQIFFNFYTRNGWLFEDKTPITDWKSIIPIWLNRNEKNQ